MFASKKFRDVFAFPALGVPPQLYATGSASGGQFAVAALGSNTGNVAGFKKWVFVGMTGSGATTTLWNFWVSGGSASTGNAMLPATSTAVFSGSNSFAATGVGSLAFGSQCNVVIEVRQEYLAGLNSTINWIRPIMSVSGASAYGAVLSLAFLSGSEPASNFDKIGAVFYELDAF